MVPSWSERAIDIKKTLAYLAIRQLVSDCEILNQGSIIWSMNSLAHEFFNMEISECADMYKLYTLIELFDVAVGNEVTPDERVSN